MAYSRFGQALGSAASRIGELLPVMEEIKRRRRLEDEDRASKTSKDNLNQMYQQIQYSLDQQDRADKRKSDAEQLSQDTTDRWLKALRFRDDQETSDLNRELKTLQIKKARRSLDETPEEEKPSLSDAQARLQGLDLRTQNINRLTNRVKGRLASINPDAFNDLVINRDLSDDPATLQSFVNSEDFAREGQVGDYADLTASASLDTIMAYSGLPVSEIANMIQTGGTFDISPYMQEMHPSSPLDFQIPDPADKQRGYTAEQDAMGRAIYDDWDNLTPEQKKERIRESSTQSTAPSAPPPNDGSYKDAEYKEFVKRWNAGLIQ